MGKHHTATFKAHLVRELLREDKTIGQLAAEHGIHPNRLSKWKAIALQGLPSLYDRSDSVATLEAAHDQQVTDLYAEIGRLTTQVALAQQTIWPRPSLMMASGFTRANRRTALAPGRRSRNNGFSPHERWTPYDEFIHARNANGQ
jgi:transposase-like protein